tara:strand:- start:3474 stop:3719 length:246 start_codon:yes stop_codon:yes gene_type:complete
MKVNINIYLKEGVLDTQGKAIESAISKNLGFENVSNVRQGKSITLNINEDDEGRVKDVVDNLCDKFLVNKVMEDYDFELIL